MSMEMAAGLLVSFMSGMLVMSGIYRWLEDSADKHARKEAEKEKRFAHTRITNDVMLILQEGERAREAARAYFDAVEKAQGRIDG